MIEDLRKQIIQANEAYRIGKPVMTDAEYDQLIEDLSLLSPDDELLTKVGHVIEDESRKSRLPIEMASMNKLKSMEEVEDWCRLKGISKSEYVVITPKFDGLSLCVNEINNDAITRGDGEYGQKSNEHYKLIGNKLLDFVIESNKCERYVPGKLITYGEVMMPKKTFVDKYSADFANPRNLVAGLINSPDARESLKDCNYIKYGLVTDDLPFDTKSELLDWLNENQEIKVQYTLSKLSDLTEEMLIDLFHKYCVDYEIDGLIIEINDLSIQNKLGRETSSNNPVWARAFKHPSFSESAEAPYLGISWNISKQGLLKPIIHIKPVKLDGVMVSNVTGNNARFVKDMGIGPGAILKIVRSGMVIPKIVDVITKGEFQMPTIFDENGNKIEYDWNEAGIEFVTLIETDEQKLKKNIAFFQILEADYVSDGVITQLWDAGYKTIKEILSLKPADLEKIDRFGKRKAQIVYKSIQKSITDVELSKLQHATGIFRGLGSKKLALLEHFKTKPTVDQVMAIEGFAEISAKVYVDNYDIFFDFVKDLPVTLEERVQAVAVSNDLEGNQFVFTGVRRADLETIIESRGGKIGSGVSKNTTHLVMKVKGSGSSKEKKALDLGVKIITVEELENLLK